MWFWWASLHVGCFCVHAGYPMLCRGAWRRELKSWVGELEFWEWGVRGIRKELWKWCGPGVAWV